MGDLHPEYGDVSEAERLYVFIKDREAARPKVTDVTTLSNVSGLTPHRVADLEVEQSLFEFSPRIGGHAFSPEYPDEWSARDLRRQLIKQDGPGNYVMPGRELLEIPHRFAARIEIDGQGLVPSLAVRSACKKLGDLMRVLTDHPLLRLVPLTGPGNFRECFVPFFSGNRSLHLLARGASGIGTGFAEGMTAWCRRVNHVGIADGLCDINGLVDPSPHIKVRSPWRCMFTMHEKSGLWANRLSWELVDQADGDAIVDLCRRPVVEDWAAAAVAAMGLDRPPDPACAKLYENLRHYSDREIRLHRCEQSCRLSAIKTNRPKSTVNWFAALVDAGLLESNARLMSGVYRLRACPSCGTAEANKSYVTPGGWVKCFRATCEFNDGRPPLGDGGWFEFLGIDSCQYGVVDDAE